MTRMEARIGRTPTARVAARQATLREIIESAAPVTVRRAFYMALGGGTYGEATVLGWRVLRVTTGMVDDGRALALVERCLR